MRPVPGLNFRMRKRRSPTCSPDGGGVALARGDEVADAESRRLLLRDVLQAQHVLQHVARAQVPLDLQLGVDRHHRGEAARLERLDGRRLRVVGGAGLLEPSAVPDVERHGRRDDAAVDRRGGRGGVVVDGVVVAHRVAPVGDRRRVHGMAGDLRLAGRTDARARLSQKRCIPQRLLVGSGLRRCGSHAVPSSLRAGLESRATSSVSASASSWRRPDGSPRSAPAS